MRRLLVLISILVLAAPPGGAQTGDGSVDAELLLTIDDAPDPIAPDGRPVETAWEVTLYLQAPLPQDVEIEIVTPDDEHAPVSFQAAPSTVTIQAGPTDDVQPPYTYTASGVLSVAVGPDAPAFYAERYEIVARTDGTELASSAETVSQATVVPGFRPGLDAEPLDQTLTVPAGEAVHARAVLTNTANGPERISYGAIDAPDGCSVAPVHDVFVLDQHSSREGVFHLACDDGASSGELSITYDAVYAPDTSVPGTAATATWDVVVQQDAATQTQASVIGTSANLGGVPVAAWAMLALGAMVGVGRRVRGGSDT